MCTKWMEYKNTAVVKSVPWNTGRTVSNYIHVYASIPN